MMANMHNDVVYVLPLGKADAEGRLTSPSWRAFVQWIFELADHLVIWTQCSPAAVSQWLGVADASEVARIPHSDPDSPLVGYRLHLRLLNWERLSQVPVSEESGVAFFAWQKGDMVLASIDVDDFENFAILNVGRTDAARLASVCVFDQWDADRFAAYKTEIDDLSAMGHWLPLSSVLDPRG